MNNQKNSIMLIKELDEIKQILKKYDDLTDLPNIESDIVMNKLRDIYDKFYGLINNSATGRVVENKEDFTRKEDNIVNTPLDDEELTDNNKEINVADDEQEEARQPEKETKKEPSKKRSVNEKVTPETLGDRYKQNGQYMNESLAEKHQPQKDISNKMQNKPIDDLNKALGVNDRFQLTRDLFHGNRASFAETIEALNNTNSFEEANNMIEENFDWDKNEPSYKMLLDLIKRKHSLNS